MIKAYAKSDKGNVRETNDDYFYISNSLDEVQLYILADESDTIFLFMSYPLPKHIAQQTFICGFKNHICKYML